MEITDSQTKSCQAEQVAGSGMKHRFIAALLLASLALSSVPVSLASSLAAGSSTAVKPAEPSSSNPHDHSCCPGVHSTFVPPVYVKLAPADLPCDEHPCCVKPGPENPPSLPAATRLARPDLQGTLATLPDHLTNTLNRVTSETSSNFIPTYSVRSTVLRI
jgi:hypothetical protein